MNRSFFQSVRLFRLKSVLAKTFFAITGLFLILILLVSFFVIHLVSDNYRTQSTTSNLHMLFQASDNLDTTFTNLSNAMYVTMWNKDIISLMTAPGHRTIDKDYTIATYLDRIETMNQLVDEIHLYLPGSGLLYTSLGVTDHIPDEANMLTSYLTDPSGPTAFHTTDRTRTTLYRSGDQLYLVQVFSINKPLGYLFYRINEEQLYSTIRGNQRLEQDDPLVYDEKGRAVFPLAVQYPYPDFFTLRQEASIIAEANAARGDYYAVQSDLLGWHFLYPVAHPTPGDYLPQIFGILLPIVLLCFAVCLLLAVYATYSIFKPVSSLIQSIVPGGTSTDGVSNEYELIQQQYLQVLEKSLDLEQQMETIAPETLRQMLFRLASGGQLPEEYIAETLDSLRCGISPDDRFAELVIHINQPQARPFQALELSLMMKSLMGVTADIPLEAGRMFSVQMDEEHVLLVFVFGPKLSVRRIKSIVLQFERELLGRLERLPYEVNTGRGGIHHGLTDLAYAYHAAMTDLRESIFGKGKHDPGLNPYRKQIERIAVAAVEGRGNTPAMVQLLCDEMAEQAGSAENAQQLLDLIIDAFLEQLIALHVPYNDPIFASSRPQESFTTVDDALQYAHFFCLSALELLSGSMQKNKHKYMNAAKTYIGENYGNSDLDLGSVARHAGINISYLSKLFKEFEGRTFVEYLSAYRVDQAKKMLEDTDMSVKEIGYLTGFNSPQNFIRVFKKYTGRTPGTYRSRA